MVLKVLRRWMGRMEIWFRLVLKGCWCRMGRRGIWFR